MAKPEIDPVKLPKGRLINESVFEMDAYKDPRTNREADPKYKVEVAFPDNDDNYDALMSALEQCVEAEWGEDGLEELDNGDIKTPILQGDKLARKREDKGKEGDAYKGMLVIRADTKYNKDGIEGAGGIAVFDEKVKPITPDRRGDLYPGCYVEVVVRPATYLTNEGDRACKFYLQAIQKVADGDRLVKAADHSKLFKPVERAEGETRQRRRRG